MESTDRLGVHHDLTWRILGSAIEVHRILGPGLLESTYRRCLLHQLELDGMRVRTEVPIPIRYKALPLEASFRADLIVEEIVLVELKALEHVLPIHDLQALTYLRLSGLPVALLVNFNVPRLKEGIRRFVNSRTCSLVTDTSP